MAAQELKALKAQRATVKGQMTKILNWVTQLDEKVDIDDINSRLNRAKELLNQFTKLEGNIFLCDAEHESQICDFNETYLSIESGLNRALRRINAENERRNSDVTLNYTQSNHHHEIKLPKIHIPSFSGDFTEWQTFYDLFVSTIHNNEHLMPAQKFQYLQGLLTGPASSIMKHLTITDQNYFEVFKKLCKKYDRKRHTINAFLQSFHNQPNIHSANAANIQKLLDTSDEVVRGLKALGKQAESRDPWLIFILVNKLDEDTRSQWAQHVFERDFPSVDEFFEFLQRRIDALDSMQVCIKSQAKSKSMRVHVTTNVAKCPICPNQDHSISLCPKFSKMNANERRDIIKSGNRCFNCLNANHAVYKCFSKRRCATCNRKHHTLLHLPTAENNSQENISQLQLSPLDTHVDVNKSSCCLHVTDSQVVSILPTALINVKDYTGQTQICRALLDCASVSSFISEECVNRLKLTLSMGPLVSISGLGNTSVGKSSGTVDLKIIPISKQIQPLNLKAFVIPKITSSLPEQTIPKRYFKQFSKIELADPLFNVSRGIDILLGADHFFDVLEPDQIKSRKRDEPVAQKTIFGWVIGGKWTQQTAINSFFTESSQETSCSTDRLLKQFWEIEEVPSKVILTEEEQQCENIFNTSTTRNKEGRYVVKLPFKIGQPRLGESLPLAITRLRSMEKRFSRDETFRDQYVKFMNEYEKLGHMREIFEPFLQSDSYYMPHHGVMKNTSTTTKLRVVFDGSSKSSSGQSLNNHLMVGAVVQNSLYAVILRFRIHKIGFTADVEKMYRQILVTETDTPFQRIVWRNSDKEPIRHFELLTVTYGTASAPFLATRVLKEISVKNECKYPESCDAILRDMYVDDIMSGAEENESAIRKKNEIMELLKDAGMNLRKFVSNSSIFMKTLIDGQHEIVTSTNIKEIDCISKSAVKVLGLFWNPVEDNFSFRVNLQPNYKQFTKRNILSEISQIFDPIGWLAPSLVRNKIFLQRLWLTSLNWDDKLPKAVENEWLKLRMELKDLEYVKIPRWCNLSNPTETHIHGFCDASEAAYAATVYLVVKNNSDCKSSLLSSKTKVAPIKQLSLPRLELCGATLLVKLINTVVNSLNIQITSINAWTDSKIVLDWLSTHPKKWNTFVANRTSEILQSTSRNQWRHVSSSENPADCASRGINPIDLINFELWWRGPTFLITDPTNWPLQQHEIQSVPALEARKGTICNTIMVSSQFFEELTARYSSYDMLTKVLAYMFRFIRNLKDKINKSKGPLTVIEIDSASTYILKQVQQKEFTLEIEALKLDKSISNKSNIKSLNPFVDDTGLLRVGGRISHSKASFGVKHPIILPYKSIITKLLVEEYHIRYHHAGATLLLSLLRQKYWIIRVKDVIRFLIRKCINCWRTKPKLEEQQMGNLPNCRLEYVRPFLKVAIDYAGPVMVYHRRGRGQKAFKSYISFFVCMSTKAIHIELVCDLTSDSFLGALRRFVARRGLCTDIYSDCGTNFAGANNKLIEMFKFLKQNCTNISHSLLKDHITWHFNPPGAPHFNGIAEAAVKSAKLNLRRTIGNSLLTVEEMMTFLAQVEAILNSRPLCILSSDDIDALTPAHFILHHPITQIPEPDLQNEKISNLSRWQLVQQLQQHFSQRWRREYLTSLQQRSKWTHKSPNIELGDIVIVKDDNLPPTKWLLARVHEVMPGDDELVRAVSIKTKNGIITRPIHKLCKLPLY